MNCPQCNAPIDPALILHERQQELAKRPRKRRVALIMCKKCKRMVSKRDMTRRPKCPHEPKHVSQK